MDSLVITPIKPHTYSVEVDDFIMTAYTDKDGFIWKLENANRRVLEGDFIHKLSKQLISLGGN